MRELRIIAGEVHHFLVREMAAFIAHFLVRAPAGLEVLELEIEIAVVLARKIGDFRVIAHAIRPMAGGAFRNGLGEVIFLSGERRR
jgi:hypothetical protein